MKEKTRQSLLSAIGWRKSYRQNVDGPVYVPMSIQIQLNLDHHISIAQAIALGAKNITVDEDCYSLQAKWPSKYFTVEEAAVRNDIV